MNFITSMCRCAGEAVLGHKGARSGPDGPTCAPTTTHLNLHNPTLASLAAMGQMHTQTRTTGQRCTGARTPDASPLPKCTFGANPTTTVPMVHHVSHDPEVPQSDPLPSRCA